MTDPRQEQIMEQATRWFVRRREADFAAADMAAMEAWLAEDAAHQQAFAIVQEDWRQLDAQQDVLADMLSAELAIESSPAPIRRWAPVALAASLLLAVAVTVIVLTSGPASEIYATGFGETVAVELEDGSRLELFANTEVEVVMRDDQRLATLRDGRAFFDVSPDPDRPFVVRALDRELRVVGTQFVVALDEDVARLAVAEGAVALSGESELVLQEGQQVRFAAASPAQPVEQIDPDALARWRDGLFYFDRTPLAEAVNSLNQYYGNVFKLGDPSLEELSLSGVYQHATPVETATALKAILPVDTRRRDDGSILILPREAP